MKRLREQRGSTVLEVALIGTVLFSLLIGLVTFAIIQASDNAGTNAAREGARAASLNVFCADAYVSVPSHSYDTTACPTQPSASYTAIVSAVTSKLGGLVVGAPQVDVACLSGSSTALTPEFCDSSVVPDVDLVRVTVTWTREATNPITNKTTKSDSATMTIHGSGKGSSDVAACLANATVNPSTVALAAGSTTVGNLSASVTVTVYTNGFCAQPLFLDFSTGQGNGDGTTANLSEQMSPMPNLTDFTYQIPATSWEWAPGTYLLSVTDKNGNRISFVAQPQLTVTGPNCQFIPQGSMLTPSSAIILGGSSPGVLTQPIQLQLTTSSGCATVSTQFNPGGSTAQSKTMPPPTPNAQGQLVYTLTLDPTLLWTVGLKAFSFTDVSDGNIPLQNEVAINLNVTTACAFQALTVSPSTVGHNNNGSLKSDVTITATPSVGADCSGLTVTFSPASGTTTQPMVLQTSGVYQYTINKNAYTWTVFTYTLTFGSNNNPSFNGSSPPATLTVN